MPGGVEGEENRDKSSAKLGGRSRERGEGWRGGERAGGTHTDEGRLEEGFRAAETFVADGDDLPVRQLVALFQGGGRGSGGHLVLKVQRHVAQLLLDVTDDLTLGCQRGAKASKITQEERGTLASPPEVCRASSPPGTPQLPTGSTPGGLQWAERLLHPRRCQGWKRRGTFFGLPVVTKE